MGRTNDVLQGYLYNNERFADFINGVYYQGEQVLDAGGLAEVSERYNLPVPETDGKVHTNAQKGKASSNLPADSARTDLPAEPGKRMQRYRDIKKQYREDGTIRILALENQNKVDYTMPFRCMQYDTLEYQKQIKELKEANRQDTDYSPTPEELLCGLRESDRLIPAYTICLYHGTESWNGPRTLKDMMSFGKDRDKMSAFFHDYPMRLYCINEETDFSVFHTGVRELFTAMRYRGDPEGLQNLMETDDNYRHLDAETVEAMAVMLDMPEIWEEKENYIPDWKEEEDDHDMCYAVQKWKEDALARGRSEGLTQGRSEGLTQGRSEGLTQGRNEGLTQGRSEGLSAGLNTGIRSLVEVCEEFGISADLTIEKLMQKFSLERKDAEDYVIKFRKQQ